MIKITTKAAVTLCGLGLIVLSCFTTPSGPQKNNPTAIGSNVDSLFAVLVGRVQTMDSIQSYSSFAERDFKSLKDGFSAVIAQTPDNPKANVGLMLSALLSINTSQRVQRLVDSLDSYSNAMSDYSNASNAPTPPVALNKKFFRTAFHKEGIIGLGKALAARTPALLKAQTAKPSFPKFITLQYIQKIAEEEIGPALDTAILAAQRLEAKSDVSIPLIIPDKGEYDTFEIDKGEIYAADGFCHLARAYIGFYCAYDMDLYAPQTNDYRWIDSMVTGGSGDSLIVYLSGDTLYKVYKYDDAKPQITLANMFKYNLSRDGFMKIRKQNHAKIKADLIAVTDCIKNGVGYIRAETDNQDNDIIKMSQISDADRGLVDFTNDLREAGISPALADKFSTPEKIAGFVKDLLSGPYQINEIVDSVRINTRINLAAWFDNPVEDLKTLLPKYKWTSESAWKVTNGTSYAYATYATDSSFTVYETTMPVVVRSPQTTIARITVDSWGYTTYVLNRTFKYQAIIDSTTYLDPLRLTDNNGVEISSDQISAQIDQKTFFPYFSDYTFHGVFPDLTTRQAWITMIYQ